MFSFHLNIDISWGFSFSFYFSVEYFLSYSMVWRFETITIIVLCIRFTWLQFFIYIIKSCCGKNLKAHTLLSLLYKILHPLSQFSEGFGCIKDEFFIVFSFLFYNIHRISLLNNDIKISRLYLTISFCLYPWDLLLYFILLFFVSSHENKITHTVSFSMLFVYATLAFPMGSVYNHA